MIWHQAVGDYGNRLPCQRFAKPSQQKQVIFIAPKYGLAVGATIVNVVITTFVKIDFSFWPLLYVPPTFEVRGTFLLIKK